MDMVMEEGEVSYLLSSFSDKSGLTTTVGRGAITLADGKSASEFSWNRERRRNGAQRKAWIAGLNCEENTESMTCAHFPSKYGLGEPSHKTRKKRR